MRNVGKTLVLAISPLHWLQVLIRTKEYNIMKDPFCTTVCCNYSNDGWPHGILYFAKSETVWKMEWPSRRRTHHHTIFYWACGQNASPIRPTVHYITIIQKAQRLWILALSRPKLNEFFILLARFSKSIDNKESVIGLVLLSHPNACLITPLDTRTCIFESAAQSKPDHHHHHFMKGRGESKWLCVETRGQERFQLYVCII